MNASHYQYQEVAPTQAWAAGDETPPPMNEAHGMNGHAGSQSSTASINSEVDDGADLSAHDFILWAKLQDPYDLSESLDRDPSLMTKMDSNNNSLLHGGAEVGNISLVEFLLKRLSAKDAKRLLHAYNSDGLEPLHVATSKGMFHIIK